MPLAIISTVPSPRTFASSTQVFVILFLTGSLPFSTERHNTKGRTTYNTRSTLMGKSQDARKETKKKPAKTMKEKRAEKKAKK
jgi:hypothetical protein